MLKPFYGLSESGDYWNETFTPFHVRYLSIDQATGDFALFFPRQLHKLFFLSTNYVDDVIQAQLRGIK